MESERFDVVTRRLSVAATRRGVLGVLAASVAFAPDRVPGITIPDSPEAMRGMDATGMDGGDESMDGESMGSGSMKGDDSGMKP